MKRLIITLVLVGLFGMATAVETAAGDEPFLHVSATPDRLDLGTANIFKDTYDVPAALTVKIDSNCMHGPIMISATKLKHRRGYSISPDRIFVKTSATNGFVPIARPVAISKPEVGSHKVVLDLRVETKTLDPAGEYTGTIMLTITPPV